MSITEVFLRRITMEERNRTLPFSVAALMEALKVSLSADMSSNGKAGPTGDPFRSGIEERLLCLEDHLSKDDHQALRESLREVERQLLSDASGTAVEWQYVAAILHILHLLSGRIQGPTAVKAAADDGSEACRPSHAGGSDSQVHNDAPDPKAGRLPHATDARRCQHDAPALPDTSLSLSDLDAARKALQLVVSLGLCPNFQPGVGIPLQHRSQHLKGVPLDAGTAAQIEASAQANRARLAACLAVFMDLLEVPELKALLLAAHLNDILAGLLQLKHAYPESVKKSLSSVQLKHAHPESDKKSLSSVEAEKQTEATSKLNESVVSGELSMKPEGSGKDAAGNANKNYATDLSTTDGDDHKENATSEKSKGPGTKLEGLDFLVSNVNHDLLIRELLVLQAGVPKAPSPPPWLKKGCSQLLVRLVTGPDGVRQLYTAISTGSAGGSGGGEWRVCGTVARIMAGCPVSSQRVTQYVSSVAQQLLALLCCEVKGGAQFTRLVGAVAAQMTLTEKYRERFHQFFHRPLLLPLARCGSQLSEGGDGRVVVSEDQLTTCLHQLHRVYIVGQSPQSGLVSCLRPVVGVLWSLFCLSRCSVYSIKNQVRELFLGYLKFAGCQAAASCLQSLCVGHADSDPDIGLPLTVRLEASSHGGLQAVCVQLDKVTVLSDSQRVEAVMDILTQLKGDGTAGELLVSLLKDLTDIISKETEAASDVILPTSGGRGEAGEGGRQEVVRRMTLLHLLATICETFGSECLTDNTHILSFVKVSLERGVAVCRRTAEEDTAIFETETMSMAMGLLTAVMAGAVQMEERHRHLMEDMLPLLDTIAQGHPDEFIQEMATDIRVAIATRGAVWSSLQKSKSKAESGQNKVYTTLAESPRGGKRSSAPAKPLIEVLSSTSEQLSQHSDSPVQHSDFPPQHSDFPVQHRDSSVQQNKLEPSHTSLLQSDQPVSSQKSLLRTRKSEGAAKPGMTHTVTLQTERSPPHTGKPEPCETPKPSGKTGASKTPTPQEPTKPSGKSRLETVFEELCDPLLPVRGHALLALTRLVEQRDAETLAKQAVVQKVFEENLRHGDSYLYLAAVGGLAALADRFPETVVPALAAEFAALGSTEPHGASPEHRLRVGEALMKATRSLGEMIPQYRDVLLCSMLSGARDKDASVRGSSLSNLAELCGLLRFSLGPVLHEVFNCCSCLLERDEIIVRRAAALTLTKILEGLDHDALTVLEPVLKDLYGLLKRCHTADPDATVRLHANMALVQLDTVARDFLFPKQTLRKNIQVLPNQDTFR